MKTRVRLIILAAAAVLAALPAWAQAQFGVLGPDSDDLDRLAARPGAEVTRRKEGDTEIMELRLGGVLTRQTSRGDRYFEESSEDRSGLGAVLCTWSLHIELRAGLDVCAQGKFPGLRERLDGAIAATNAFIVTNGLRPTPMAQVEASAAWLDGFHRARAPFEGCRTMCLGAAGPCRGVELEQVAAPLSLMSRAEWERSVAEFLSVPRPPVNDPCPQRQ